MTFNLVSHRLTLSVDSLPWCTAFSACVEYIFYLFLTFNFVQRVDIICDWTVVKLKYYKATSQHHIIIPLCLLTRCCSFLAFLLSWQQQSASHVDCKQFDVDIESNLSITLLTQFVMLLWWVLMLFLLGV